jgi:cold shock CspA family protein
MSDEPTDPRSKRAGTSKRAAPVAKVGGKPKESGRAASGTILRIVRGQNHGFIRAADGREVFFHRADVTGTFIDLEIGDTVACELIEDRVSGVRAVSVRKITT